MTTRYEDIVDPLLTLLAPATTIKQGCYDFYKGVMIAEIPVP